MLSVAKLTPGQERYYERSVAAGLDDYYAGRGESPGLWTGRGAAELALKGVVADGQLGALIRGLHPLDEQRLRRHPKERTITIERIDPHTDERRIEHKKLSPVAGYDLTFSAPKSVSLLHALGDEQTRRAVNEAHTSAWQAALAYLENEACAIRRGKGGVIRERGRGFVGAAYQHRTSRAQDPHLHTHVIVANMAQSPSDGEWRALDGEALLKTYRLAAGYLYQSHLRAELQCTLGVEWERPIKGMAELRGVPHEALREFSKRRLQVLEQLRESDASGFYAAQVAAVETRERKEHVGLGRLREEWRARAAEHGLGRRELANLIGRAPRREPTPAELQELANEMLAPKGLTERRTAFADPDVVMAWAEAHQQGATAERLLRISKRFVEVPDVERVGERPTAGRPAHYSTAELVATERRGLAVAEKGRGGPVPVVPDELIAAAVTGEGVPELSAEQGRMIRAVCQSSDQVVCVVGLAGSGKTTATSAVARTFQAVRVPVLGAAPSGVAAEKLQDETGIASTTLHRLLNESGGGLPAGSVVIIDEAGMAETRVLAPLLERVEQAGGKAILIGDPHQLPPVGAGGLFAGIIDRHGALELTENRRQHDPLERQALAKVRDGLGRDYLAFAEKRERLVVSESATTTRTRLVADWWNAARDDLAGSVMIALRRRDAAELNAIGRTLMDTHGRLGHERLAISGREFAAGDRVVCLRNNSILGVQNGTRGTVESVDREKRTITVSTDRGNSVELSRQYLTAGHVRHAYALTGHSSQGVTVERAFVLGSGEARLQEWGYVALSRAREETRVYVTGTVRERESHVPDADDRDPVARFAQALEESAIERLGVDQAPLPSGPKHGAHAEIQRATRTDAERTSSRMITQERLAVAKARVEAEEKLTDAERRLEKLPRFGRAGIKNELRSELARRRAVLEAAEERLSAIRDCERAVRERGAGHVDRPCQSHDTGTALAVDPQQRGGLEL